MHVDLLYASRDIFVETLACCSCNQNCNQETQGAKCINKTCKHWAKNVEDALQHNLNNLLESMTAIVGKKVKMCHNCWRQIAINYV